MAKVIWEDGALSVLLGYIENARFEYGGSTVKRWQKERKNIEWRLARYPVSYPPEELLHKRSVLYRRCHMMSRRFKVIYYYDEKEDVVHLIDIWDIRMSPSALIRRIK